MYFAFTANGLRLASRCKIAANHAGEIAQFGLDSYFRFQVAKVVEIEQDLRTLFAGLRALSGIEVLRGCGDVTETVCGRITDVIDEDLQHRESDEILSRALDLVIDYLHNEAGNAWDEYERVGRTKPSGVPYFVREHALHFFLDYVLSTQFSARKVFDALDQTGWYDGTRLDLHPRIAAEMRREGNLAFGRWYRGANEYSHYHRNQLIASSYRTLIRSLVDEALAGDAKRGETAYFLLRHTAAPRDHYGPESERRQRDLVIGPEFAQDFDNLKMCGAMNDLFARYPIQVSGRM